MMWIQLDKHIDTSSAICLTILCVNEVGRFIRRDRTMQRESNTSTVWLQHPRYGYNTDNETNSNRFHYDLWTFENIWDWISPSCWALHHMTTCISHDIGSIFMCSAATTSIMWWDCILDWMMGIQCERSIDGNSAIWLRASLYGNRIKIRESRCVIASTAIHFQLHYSKTDWFIKSKPMA